MRLGLAGTSSGIGFQAGEPYSPVIGPYTPLALVKTTRRTSSARAASSTLTSPMTLTWMLSAGLDAENRTDEGRRMHHVRHMVLLDRLQQTRHVEHVALLKVDLLDDVTNQGVVAMAGEDHRTVPFAHKLAAGLGADNAHSAGDENFHLTRSWRRPR